MRNADEIINETLARLRQQDEEWEKERPRLAAISGQQHLGRKLERFLKRPDNTNAEDIALAGEDLLDEIKIAYLNNGGNPAPAWMQDAIKAKNEKVRAGAPKNEFKNRGGNPGKYPWDQMWIEIVRFALMDATGNVLPERTEFQRKMVDWCANAWGNLDHDNEDLREKLQSQVRDRLRKLYETPGIQV